MSYYSQALESKVEAMAFLIDRIRDPSLRLGVVPGEVAQWKTDISMLAVATPFYWNAKTVELVTSISRDFNLDDIKATRHMLPTDHSWHWFAEDAPPFSVEVFELKQMHPVRAISVSWFDYSKGVTGPDPFLGATVWTHLWGKNTGPLVPVLWLTCDPNKPMSQVVDDSRLSYVGTLDERAQIETNLAKLFIAASSTFLRQKLLAVESVSPERHARKRVERRGGRPMDIGVVHLRKLEPRAPKPGESAARDWKWQWTVGGHVRQQWYPSLNEHLPVWIHPYIKGDPEKPMKPRSTPIMAVVR